jgi:hypothetical protein
VATEALAQQIITQVQQSLILAEEAVLPLEAPTVHTVGVIQLIVVVAGKLLHLLQHPAIQEGL